MLKLVGDICDMIDDICDMIDDIGDTIDDTGDNPIFSQLRQMIPEEKSTQKKKIASEQYLKL